MADDAPARHHVLELRVEREPGLARGVLHHADALQSHGIAEAGSHRLGKGFLRREAIGQEQHRLGRLEIAGPFQRGQHASRKALAVLLDEPLDAMRLDHVYTDAVDHAGPLMSAFISRTACAMPTKTDRPTMECPMLSSRICGMPAIGRTLS